MEKCFAQPAQVGVIIITSKVTIQGCCASKRSRKKKSNRQYREWGYRMHEKRFSGGIERLRSQERMDRLEVPRVIQFCLEENNYHSVLDVGTGSGLFAEGFAGRGLRITGIDANFEMLPAARSFIPQGDFLQATAEALPFTDKSFDLAFLGLVLHEADDTLAMLQAAHRISRKRVCILEWPYIEQTFGPPLRDRLSPVKLEKLFLVAGFSSWKCDRLSHVDLYRLSR